VWVLVFGVLGFAGLMAWDATQNDRDLAVEIPPPPGDIPDPDSIPVLPDQPSPLDAVRSNAAGISFFNARQFDSALVYFEQAVEIDPGVPEYHRNLGLALLRSGDASAAEAELRSAIDLAPDLAPAYESLARAQLALGDTTAAMESLGEYLERESDPQLRGAVERDLAQLRALQNPDVDLLGETVEPTQPTPAPGPTAPNISGSPTGPGPSGVPPPESQTQSSPASRGPQSPVSQAPASTLRSQPQTLPVPAISPEEPPPPIPDSTEADAAATPA
jgi:hypothetical protein